MYLARISFTCAWKAGSAFAAAYASSSSRCASTSVSGTYRPPKAPKCASADATTFLPVALLPFSDKGLSLRFLALMSTLTSPAMKLATASAAPFTSGASSTALQMAEPTTTPSAIEPTSATCAGVEMPKPTASGSEVYLRTRLMKSPRSTGSAERAPVTPVRDTQYMNELATEASCSMRSLVEVGVRSGTYERSYLDARLTNSKPSSGGRSTTMKPATPLALHSDMSRSSPKAKKGL
mmetsp:Transcript_14263/g.30125  ORF Transcript_14263/g.30125 Transcript_14263/m.30125 type:complete len:237 (+) Transcript_14263:1363-2073(+)